MSLHRVACPTCHGDAGFDDELGVPTCMDCELNGWVMAKEGTCASCWGSGIPSGVQILEEAREVKVVRGKNAGKTITIGPGFIMATFKGDCPECEGRGYFGGRDEADTDDKR